MMSFVVNLIGLILIMAIVAWFWLVKKKVQRTTENIIDIIVENGVYTPDLIKVKQGQALQLRFIRKDTTPCSQTVIFSDLDISADLPINQPHILPIKIDQPGEFEFTCQMSMYRGWIIVE